MNYFVIQVLTRSEEKFIRLANNVLFGKPGRRRVAIGTTTTGRPGEGSTAEVRRFGGLVEDHGNDQPLEEKSFIELPTGFSPGAMPGRLVWPRRKLTIRRRGVQQTSLAPIFPGYVFYEAEEVQPQIYWMLKQLSGFIRFLRNDGNLETISEKDRELLLHFLSYGEVVDKSLVYFDENNRIRVKSGPMKGLEGRIVKVDKRKRRAKIRLSMYAERFLVDFGFEVLESAEDNERKAN